MAIPKIQTARFLLSAVSPTDLPNRQLPEVAFWGRSNVGKSSLINTLLHRKNLVRTSSRPGCTQAINYFLINDSWYFVDLPGYGYAQVPVAIKERWLRLIDVYLEERASLRAVVLLLDSRRLPGPEELAILGNLRERQRQPILVLTKADKLTQGERHRQMQKITACLALAGVPAPLWFSALTHEGRRELWDKLLSVLVPPKEKTPGMSQN